MPQSTPNMFPSNNYGRGAVRYLIDLPPLPPCQIRSKADAMKHGRAGAEETATDAHLHGDPTKKALVRRDGGVSAVTKAQDLNYTNVYIFGVRSLRPDRSEDEVNPLTLRALVGRRHRGRAARHQVGCSWCFQRLSPTTHGPEMN